MIYTPAKFLAIPEYKALILLVKDYTQLYVHIYQPQP